MFCCFWEKFDYSEKTECRLRFAGEEGIIGIVGQEVSGMKLFVYSYRDFDEAVFFTKFSQKYHVELGICREAPTLENAHLAQGYEYISILTTKIDGELVERFHQLGVKMISTRTVGYDHIDVKRATQLGMEVGNATY